MIATFSLIIFLFLTKSSGNVSARHVITTSDKSEPSRPLTLVINLNDNLLRSGGNRNEPEAEKIHYAEQRLLERQKKLLDQQQSRKRAELLEFMKSRYRSTNYFYDEMKRIMSKGKVMDGMRRMIDYLQKPENREIKRRVRLCFERYRKFNMRQKAIPDFSVNNLVVNYVKDPFNDGVH